MQGVCCTAGLGDAVGTGWRKWIRSTFLKEYSQHSGGVRGVSVQQKAVSTYKPPACVINSCILNQNIHAKSQSQLWGYADQTAPNPAVKRKCSLCLSQSHMQCILKTDKANQRHIHHWACAESNYCTKKQATFERVWKVVTKGAVSDKHKTLIDISSVTDWQDNFSQQSDWQLCNDHIFRLVALEIWGNTVVLVLFCHRVLSCLNVSPLSHCEWVHTYSV